MSHRQRPRRRLLAAFAALTIMASACAGDEAAVPDVSFSTQPNTSAAAPTTTSASVDSTPAGTDSTIAETTPPTTVPAPPLGDPAADLQEVANLARSVDLSVRPGDDRAYVVGQRGTVARLEADGTSTIVLDITDLTSAVGEQGLLGLAFHPTEDLAYVNYTDGGGDTVVAEYRVADDGTFDAGSARQLLTVRQPYENHNGGGVAFGPDGMLYIGMGDGGSGGDPERVSLDVGNLLGKMLRIDVTASAGSAYTVPPDNPFVGVSGARPEIWAVGLRNPWRFAFDAATGDLWIADVGQNAWEEISVGWADADGMNAGKGLSFGWSAFEGTHRYNDDQPGDGHTPPLHEYPHGDLGCSISGGRVYRGTAIPELVGWYVYADYCSGQVRALQVVDRAVVKELTLATAWGLVAVTEAPDGELMVLNVDGPLYRLVPA
jgi:glucose/arabinose dehydrogenase